MDPAHKLLGRQFADKIIARDFSAARALLAPWLQDSMTSAALQGVIEERLTEMMEYAECKTLTYPVGCDIDGNSCTLEDLQDDEPFPPEVTPANFRKWMCLQFLADESVAIDAWFDLWMALVEVDGKLAVGFFKFEDPD